MMTIWLLLLRQLQKRCKHPPRAVRLDLLEGGRLSSETSWCEICGAVRMTWWIKHDEARVGEWRSPRPDYYTPAAREAYRRDLQEANES